MTITICAGSMSKHYMISLIDPWRSLDINGVRGGKRTADYGILHRCSYIRDISLGRSNKVVPIKKKVFFVKQMIGDKQRVPWFKDASLPEEMPGV